MSVRLTLIVTATVALAVVTVAALLDVGYFGILEPHFTTWGGAQVFLDLVIACVLACIWMVRDAKANGLTVWPYLLLTATAGSFGPLAYLLVRELRTSAQRAPVTG